MTLLNPNSKLLKYSREEIANLQAGQGDRFTLSDPAQLVEKKFNFVMVLEDTQFHTLTDAGRTSYSLANKKLADPTAANCIIVPAGTIIPGEFTQIRIHSGFVMCFGSGE